LNEPELTSQAEYYVESFVGAILANEGNLLKELIGGYDGHILKSMFFWRKEWEQLIGKPYEDTLAYNQLGKKLVKEGNPKAKELRQTAKSVGFGLSYGAFPKKVAKQIGCSLEEAQHVFDAYHKQLYPAITTFREQYALPTAMKNRELHLNWGLRLRTRDAKKDIRTLFNALQQGYSVLTQIAALTMRQKIIDAGKTKSIKLVNLIHDALYYELDDNPIDIQWLNDNLIPTMTKDFLIKQKVKLQAALDIGYNLYHVKELPKNATVEEIKIIQNQLKETH